MTQESELALLVRIDERTKNTDLVVMRLHTWMDNHEKRDREDFKEDRARISKVEKKQNWMLGIGSALSSTFILVGGIIVAWGKGMFTGPS